MGIGQIQRGRVIKKQKRAAKETKKDFCTHTFGHEQKQLNANPLGSQNEQWPYLKKNGRGYKSKGDSGAKPRQRPKII